jgi:predicted class III extradiol MEMO1 family dioxygenase
MNVREQSSPDVNPHYHTIVLVNGQARRDGHYIQRLAERVWNTTLGINKLNSGLVNNCTQHGQDYIVIDKNQPDYEDKIEQALDQAKYLAKTRTKEFNPQGSWRCTGTRIPKK